MLATLDSALRRRLMKTSVNTMDLDQLCEALLPELPAFERGGPSVLVRGLASDSRRVEPGDLFIASAGADDDGLRYVDEALGRGAVGVVAASRPSLPEEVAFVGVSDVPRAKALLADRYFGSPSRRLRVVGVTGTNGKTTSAFMLRSMLMMEGRRTGLVGTLGAWFDQRHEALSNTTPDAIDVQRLLARMVDENYDAVVMEASSHGLDQLRVHGMHWAAGVFTNLTRDHLDYHETMERYAAAKARLFAALPAGAFAVLNAGDPAAEQMAAVTGADVVRYGLERPADVRGDVLRLDADGTAFRLDSPRFGAGLKLTTRLVGRHNTTNALAAAAAALALGIGPAAIRTGLASLAAVPGRLEPVDCGQDFRVLVDYAHTPDALEQVLKLLRPLTRGRLLVVFGCGGDRDKTKRPLMGRAVAGHADQLFLTSDNPRTERPEAILDDVLAGLESDDLDRTRASVDRREAIESACREARGGDIVLIAGKGHETTQTLADRVVPFDDRQVTREVLWSL